MSTQAKQSFFTELRGPVGFESLYQGQSCTIPIILSTSETGLDQDAGAQFGRLKQVYSQNGKQYPIVASGEGISPYLICGLPVPAMSTALIWIPALETSVSNPAYQYQFIWRIRSFKTAGSRRRPFHGRNSRPGPEDSGQNNYIPALGTAAWTGASALRYPILAAEDTLVYAQTEPTGGASAEANVYWLRNTPHINSDYVPPFVQSIDGANFAYGQVSQGLLPNPTYGIPSHLPVTTMCKGDELCILVSRPAAGELSTWNFNGIDSSISSIYGRGILVNGAYVQINAGIMVATGVTP